jgi:hypothetical protein
MNTNITSPYPQIDAIKPTANMQYKTKQLNKARNQAVAIVIGSIVLSAITTYAIIGVIGFAIALFKFRGHVSSIGYIGDESSNSLFEESDFERHNREYSYAVAGIGAYPEMYGVPRNT